MPDATTSNATADAVAYLDEAVARVNGHIGNLRAEVETVLAPGRGTAASAFAHVYDSFEQQAYKINSALRRMRDALATTENFQV